MELAGVFEKNEKKNKTTSVYRLRGHKCIMANNAVLICEKWLWDLVSRLKFEVQHGEFY